MRVRRVLSEEDEVGDGAAEDEDAVERQGDEEEVEEAVVPLAHAVADPGAVVVEALHAVVADRAVRGPRRPKDLAAEAVLELDRLAVDDHLLRAGRGSVGRALVLPVAGLDLDLPLGVPSLFSRRPGNDTCLRRNFLHKLQGAHKQNEPYLGR